MTARIYRLEIRNELLKTVRMPVFVLAGIMFPLMFYILFGTLYGQNEVGGLGGGTYMLATFGAFGVMGVALFGFGVGVATERGQGWMILKRASPMPPLAWFSAKTFMAVLSSSVTVMLLFLAGSLITGVRLEALTWAQLYLVLVAGAIPFSALGLAFGYLCGPNSAPIVVNLVYMPMGFFSGLWMPLEILPAAIQGIAPWLPAYHFGQLALDVIGASRISSIWPSIIYLAVFTIVCTLAAGFLYRRNTGKAIG